MENAIPNIQDINYITQCIPHRYPFLLVDKIIQIQKKNIKALKNISFNEPQFQGHFPQYPIMPGVLIIEGIAQCSAILTLNYIPKPKNFFLTSVNQAKFRKPVLPGHQLIYHVNAVRIGQKFCKFQGLAFVNDTLVSEAQITASLNSP